MKNFVTNVTFLSENILSLNCFLATEISQNHYNICLNTNIPWFVYSVWFSYSLWSMSWVLCIFRWIYKNVNMLEDKLVTCKLNIKMILTLLYFLEFCSMSCSIISWNRKDYKICRIWNKTWVYFEEHFIL